MIIEKEKPTALKVIPENIPEELKKIPHWTLWNYRLLNNGTYDKPPLQPSGKYADVSKPETWSTFEEVTEALPNFDGIGFVLTEDLNIVGIDIDKLNEYPDIAPEILDDVETLETYYEKSPSGNGIRAFVKACMDLPEHNEKPFEIFNTSKVLSVTGQQVGTQKSVAKAPRAFTYFYRKWVLNRKSAAASTMQKGKGNCEPGKWKPSPDEPDDVVIERLKIADKSGKFKKLFFEGDMSDYPGTGNSPHDESRAESGLIGIIARYTQKEDQIIRLMWKSALATPDRKEKWEREDYFPRTIKKVLSKLTWTFQPIKDEKKEKNTKEETRDPFEIPENLHNLIATAKESGEKGTGACLSWVHEHYLELASVPLGIWRKHLIKGTKVEGYPTILHVIADAFDLDTTEDEFIYQVLWNYASAYNNEKKRLSRIKIDLCKYPENVKQKAVDVLYHGDPFQYVYATWQKKHVGDKEIGKALTVCASSTLVVGANEGLHFKPSGESGKGKTSGIDTFLNLLPSAMVVRGGISDKYIYYAKDEISDGSIIFMDDRDLSDNLKGVVKNSISNFQNPEAHKTVLDGKPVSYTPAKRMAWMFASVDGFDDEQLLNRFLMADVNSSEDQDATVLGFQGDHETERLLGNDCFETEVCHCIFDILRLQTYDVIIPFNSEIAKQWKNKKNRRNFLKFRDIIKAVCVYKYFQRNKIKGYTIATFDDLLRALTIYGGTAKQCNTNLTAEETTIIQYLSNKNLENEDFRENPCIETAYWASTEEIAEAFNKKAQDIKRRIIGRPERGTKGLDGKIEHFFTSKNKENHNCITCCYTGLHDFTQYESFCGNVSPDKAEELTKEFIKAFSTKEIEPQKPEDIIKKAVFSGVLPIIISSSPSFEQLLPMWEYMKNSDAGRFESSAIPTIPICSQGWDQIKNNNSRDEKIKNNSEIPKNRREGGIENRDLSLESGTQPKEKTPNNIGFWEFGNSTLNKDKKESSDTVLCLIPPLGVVGNSGNSRDEKEPSDADLHLIPDRGTCRAQEEKEKSQKLWENQFSTLGLANPDKLHRITSRKKKREPQKGQKTIPEDEDYGDVPGVEVIDFDNDPDAQKKWDAFIDELDQEGY